MSDAFDDVELLETDPLDSRRDRGFRRYGFSLTIIALMLLFTVFVFWRRMVVTVHSGEEGVLWHRFTGTELTRVYLEGTHLIWPWDRLYVYDIRIQRTDYTVDVLSTDGLDIKVDVTIRYQPVAKALPYLHQRIGPDYVNRIVVPEVVTAVRDVMGKYRPQQLYTIRTNEAQDQIIGVATEQVRDRFVAIDDVLIRRIKLPAVVEAAIQQKLNQEQEALEYVFRVDKEKREAERKKAEADGILVWEQIVQQGLTPDLLRWKGIEATLELAKSNNAKIVVVGGRDGMPLILNSQTP